MISCPAADSHMCSLLCFTLTHYMWQLAINLGVVGGRLSKSVLRPSLSISVRNAQRSYRWRYPMLCRCLFSVFFSVKMSTATKRDHTMLLQPPWLRESYATQMSVMVLIPGINKALVFCLESWFMSTFCILTFSFRIPLVSLFSYQSNSVPLPMFLSQASATSSFSTSQFQLHFKCGNYP